MRDRHMPRICRTCHAPMARQESSCWQCGAVWQAREPPPPAPPPSDTAGDADRWADEGGSLAPSRPVAVLSG